MPLRVEDGALVATLKDVPFFGYLEGRVTVKGQHLARRGTRLQGYAFAVPDTQDLRTLLQELA